MDFTQAYILGVQRRNDYFGERTAQYRSVDTISIEGYIDVRADNSDYKGVRQTLSIIDAYVDAASSSAAVCEQININGRGFGSGRLVSIDFPASEAIDENQILYGKYSANIEIYNSGNLGNTFEGPRYLTDVTANHTTDIWTKVGHNLLDGQEVVLTSYSVGAGPSVGITYYVGNVSGNTFQLFEDITRTITVDVTSSIGGATLEIYNIVPFPQYLDSFSEDFNVSLDESNTYNFSHSLDITYLSGVEGGGDPIDPIATAKSLAINLFDQTPAQFSTVIPPSYGSISAASRKYFNESYNLIDGSCTFEKQLSLLPSGLSTYSLKVSNEFSFDDQGIVTVSENGEISPRSPDFLEEAKEALDTELSKSYDRCNSIYDSYKNYLGANSSSLYSQPITKNKTLNNSEGTSSYTVEYTDNLTYVNLNTIEERQINLNISDNITTVSEDGTIISINSKSVDFDPYTLMPSRATVKNRCEAFYNENMPASNPYALKNLNNKFTVPRYGKQITYNYVFTSDANVFDLDDDAVFSRKEATHADKIGTPEQSTMIIPNVSSAILHTPGQTSMGTRSSSFKGSLRRPRFTNNLDNRPTPTAAINTVKQEVLSDAYMVFANNNLIRSVDKNQIYVTSASYTFDSQNSFSMKVDCTFTMKRQDGGSELNLTFSP